MTVEWDSLTIKDLEARYTVTRSNVYNRLNRLKAKGYPLAPEKQGGKSIFNADQVAVMDALDRHIKAGHAIASFPSAGNQFPGSRDSGAPSHSTQDTMKLAYVSQDTQDLPYNTQDTDRIDQSKMLRGFLSAMVALKSPEPDPLAHLETLERVAEKGWLLSTSQLAPLLGLKSLHGQTFSRYGFTFTRVKHFSELTGVPVF